MKFLYVLFIISFFLFLLCLVKIKLLFVSKRNFLCEVYLKILFFKFKLFSSFKSAGDYEEKKIVENKRKNLKQSSSVQRKSKLKREKKSKKKQSIFEKLGLVGLLFEPSVKLLKFLNRGFKIKNFRINFEIAGEDACKTAVFYGNFCCFFYGFFKLLSSVCNVEVDHIKIEPNFRSEVSNYNSSFCMQIRIGRLFAGLFLYIFTIIVKIFLNNINQNKVKNRMKT